jgi:hypothetical protein
MDKSLISTAFWNSGLLALCFFGCTARNFATNQPFCGVVAALATIGTVVDAVKFYNLM